MARVLCHNCGRANPRTARFCAACGRTSPSPEALAPSPAINGPQRPVVASEQDKHTLPEQSVATLKSLPVGAALLVATGSATVGPGFRLEAESLTAGRHSSNDIILDDPSVSRHHAEFRRRGDTYAVRDLGGLHGTHVNHERVEEAVLTSRDEIRLGRVHLVFMVS